jgi:hypothetical protein
VFTRVTPENGLLVQFHSFALACHYTLIILPKSTGSSGL